MIISFLWTTVVTDLAMGPPESWTQMLKREFSKSTILTLGRGIISMPAAHEKAPTQIPAHPP
jgi:hypothetical protein